MALTDLLGNTVRGLAAGLALYVAGCSPSQSEAEKVIRSELRRDPSAIGIYSDCMNVQVEELEIHSIQSSNSRRYGTLNKHWNVSVSAKGSCDSNQYNWFKGSKLRYQFAGDALYAVGKNAAGDWIAEPKK